jgi:hypothetical protein
MISSKDDASMEAGQTFSSEAKAAEAADNLNMELEDSHTDYEYNPEIPLRDYNEDSQDEEDPIPALKKRTNGKEAVPSEDKETKN